MKIGILEPSDFSEQAIKSINTIGRVECFDGKNLSTFVKDKTVLFVRLNIHINKALLASAKVLKYICSPTTGLNHIDTEYCQHHNHFAERRDPLFKHHQSDARTYTRINIIT